MMKNYKNSFLLLLMAAVLNSCSVEDANNKEAVDLKMTQSNATYTTNDLVGKWNIYRMTSDVEIDFDGDSNSSLEILTETACFNPMFYLFDELGEITTGQAKLSFLENGQFNCSYGEYSATYKINGDQLSVTFLYNGNEKTETKIITLTTSGEDRFMHVTLLELETTAYVTDPGTTTASDINKIEMVYIKER